MKRFWSSTITTARLGRLSKSHAFVCDARCTSQAYGCLVGPSAEHLSRDAGRTLRSRWLAGRVNRQRLSDKSMGVSRIKRAFIIFGL
jgi:hypothetical protein